MVGGAVFYLTVLMQPKMVKSQFKKGLKFGKKVILSKIIGNILIEYGGKSMKKKTLLLFLLPLVLTGCEKKPDIVENYEIEAGNELRSDIST